MTIKQISFHDFTRGYIPADILLLMDKETKRKRGLFVSEKYADDILEYIKKMEQNKRDDKRRALLDFVGAFGDDPSFANISHKEIKALKYE